MKGSIMRTWILNMYMQYVTTHPVPWKGGSKIIIKLKPNKASSVWLLLATEGRLDTINLLKKVERKEKGYRTLIIPKNGYSSNLATHIAVLKWLRTKKVNVYSPKREISELTETLVHTP